MKKFVLIFATAFMLCTTATMAQKVDLEGIVSKMEKSDADVANAKKAVKASTWVNRGDAYINSIIEPTKALFVGMDLAMVEAACGKAYASADEVINGTTYMKKSHPYFVAYFKDNKLAAWSLNQNKIIRKDALDVAIESYDKAMEIDPSVKDKVKSNLDIVSNHYKVLGNNAVALNQVASGAASFMTVADISELAVNGGKVDPSVLFYAGYMLTIDGEVHPASYAKGEKAFRKALDNGYLAVEEANTELDDSDRGNVYYYLFTCIYGQRANNSAKLADAKATLVEGIEKFPANERIFEGLMQLYTNEKDMGNPAELLPTVEANLAKNSKNRDTWFSRGRIYYAMKNYDECIASFEHVVELDPKFYEGNFYLGLFHMLKGDSMLDDINSQTYSDQSKYNADIEALNNEYAKCIPYFEVAHELKPTDRGTLEYLKQLCFRLRDMPGIMDKYTKYNELLMALPEE